MVEDPTNRPHRLRILMCASAVEPGPVGGAERQAMLQSRELTTRGHRVTLVGPRAGGARVAMRDGVRVVQLPRFPVRPFRTLTYLAVLFVYLLAVVRRYDLVHVHLAGPHADIAALACRLLGRPLYVKIATGGPRGEIATMRRLAPFTRRIGLRWAAMVQAISDEIEQDLLSVGIPASRILRIPNGIDPTVIRPPSADEQRRLREELGLPVDRTLVLYAGRFVRYKGLFDLFEAWFMQPPADPYLVLVGEPRHDDDAGTLPEREDVAVHAWTRDIARYHRAIDVLVLPSHAEGMSNTLLEAMCAGRAIVATAVGAAPTMLADGAGIVVPPQDPPRLRSALDAVVRDPTVRASLGSAARDRVERRYGIGPVVDALEAAYAAILAARRPA